MVVESTVPILPVVIQNSVGEVVGVEKMGAKAYKKSLEGGCLWINHPTTGRVLPADVDGRERKLVELKKYDFGYVAVISEGDSGEPREGGDSWSESAGEEGADRMDGILHQLYRVVSDRRNKMPEGSYTSHLFRSGLNHIRKKLGEEAIELILADGEEEVVLESADLLYHFVVLLVGLNVPLATVLENLEKRA